MRRPHAFKAVYTVTLHGEQLRTEFRVINTGDAPFNFTAALHTYIEVLDIKAGSQPRMMVEQCLVTVTWLPFWSIRASCHVTWQHG